MATARTQHTQTRRDEKLKRESKDLGDLTLAQIAAQYRGLVGGQQPAFLAQVLSRIMRRTRT